MTTTILVTGATGDIGSHLVRLLKQSDVAFRVMCRRLRQIQQFRQQGVDAVLGDFDRPATLLDAMRGITNLFLLTFPGPAQERHGRDAVDMAVRSGVRYIVHLGAQDAEPDSPVPWAAAPARTDDLIRESGLNWTLIRPTAFMQNLLQSAATVRRGFLPQTTGNGVAGWIDTHDIARVAAHVLTGGQQEDHHADHNGADYVLTGPELLSLPDIAALMTSRLGHPVRYVHLPAPIFQATMRLAGTDAWQARGMRIQFADVLRHGKYGIPHLTDTVTTLTGREPRLFEDFLRDNYYAFTRR